MFRDHGHKHRDTYDRTTHTKKDSCISLRSTILLKSSHQKSRKCSLSHCLDQHSAISHYGYTKNQFHSSSGLSVFRD